MKRDCYFFYFILDRKGVFLKNGAIMKRLYYNATFFSMRFIDCKYQAVLCEDGVIVDVFHDVPEHLDCEYVDLRGSFVLPGFVDSHTHSFEGGLYQNGCDLSQCDTLSDVLDNLRATTPFGDMVFAWKFDENRVRERRFPTRAELDKVCPAVPVLLRRVDGHSSVVNTMGLRLSHISPNSVSDILRGSDNDVAAHSFHRNLSADAIVQCYMTAQSIALQNGHTGIHTMIGDATADTLHFEMLLNRLDDFIIDFTLYPQCFDVEQVVAIYDKVARDIKVRRIGGCMLADGSFGSGTAALSIAYQKNKNHKGVLYHSQSFWNDFVNKSQSQGLQVGVHCIGDMAIEQITKAVLSCQRHCSAQIIHCEYVRDDMLPEMKQAGVYAVMQPMFDALWGGENGFYADVLGKERLKYLNRFRTLTECGIVVVGSSDWYITDLSALGGINSAMRHHISSERLSNFEAIKLYTTNHAQLTAEEDTKGLIEKKYAADFVCLDRDIMSLDDVSGANVLFTIKDGNIVYERC